MSARVRTWSGRKGLKILKLEGRKSGSFWLLTSAHVDDVSRYSIVHREKQRDLAETRGCEIFVQGVHALDGSMHSACRVWHCWLDWRVILKFCDMLVTLLVLPGEQTFWF